jgi:hypothetical protein
MKAQMTYPRPLLALEDWKLVTIALFANDYYKGQNSRLYRIMCRAIRLLKKRGWTMMDIFSAHRRCDITPLYHELVAKYGEEAR